MNYLPRGSGVVVDADVVMSTNTSLSHMDATKGKICDRRGIVFQLQVNRPSMNVVRRNNGFRRW